MNTRGVVAVVGATGRQGGAVARKLLTDGWQVRALTRSPDAAPSRALAQLGASPVRCDLMDLPSLVAAFDGADGVYSVQNTMTAGDAEIEQGSNVGDAARTAGVAHVVYGSAGTGVAGTGIASWDNKVAVAEHLRSTAVPLTVLRPMAFMELMSDKDFYPPASTWHVMPKLVGADRPLPWLAVADLGAIAARAFAEPDTFVGKDLAVASELRSLAECREIWERVTGRAPRSFPMPTWLLQRFVGPDIPTMWRWLRDGDTGADVETTRTILPSAMSVEEWVRRRNGSDA